VLQHPFNNGIGAFAVVVDFLLVFLDVFCDCSYFFEISFDCFFIQFIN